MAGLSSQVKHEFKSQILGVQGDFSDAGFKQLVKRLMVLEKTEIFVSLEAWLKELITADVYLAHGLLSWLYYHAIQDYQTSAEHALAAARYFPDTEIWENLASNALTDEAIEMVPGD